MFDNIITQKLSAEIAAKKKGNEMTAPDYHPALTSTNSAPAIDSPQLTAMQHPTNDKLNDPKYLNAKSERILSVNNKRRPRIHSAPKRPSRNQIKPITPPRRPSRSKSKNSTKSRNSNSIKKDKNNNKQNYDGHVHFDDSVEPNAELKTSRSAMTAKKRRSSVGQNPLSLMAAKRRSFHVSSATQPQITFRSPISAKNINDKLSQKDPNVKVKNLGFVQVTNSITGKKETLFLRKKKKYNNNGHNAMMMRKKRRFIKMHSQQMALNKMDTDGSTKQDEKEEFYTDQELEDIHRRFPDYHQRVSKHRNYASEHITRSPSNRSVNNEENKTIKNENNLAVKKHIVQSSSPTDAYPSVTNSRNNSIEPMPSPIMQSRGRDGYGRLNTSSNTNTPSMNPRGRAGTYGTVATYSSANPSDLKGFSLNNHNGDLIAIPVDSEIIATPSPDLDEDNLEIEHDINDNINHNNDEEKGMEEKSYTIQQKIKMRKLNVDINGTEIVADYNPTGLTPVSPVYTTDEIQKQKERDAEKKRDRMKINDNPASQQIMMVDLKSESDALSLGDHSYHHHHNNNNYNIDVDIKDDMELSMITPQHSRNKSLSKSKSKLKQWHQRVASKLNDIFAVDGRFDDDGIYVDFDDYRSESHYQSQNNNNDYWNYPNQ